MNDAPSQASFPPLIEGRRLPGDEDPFAAAIEGARDGDDGGVLYWADRADQMQAALVLAPETRLDKALAMVFAAEQALTDALGALAPAETAVEWGWPDQLMVNGARVGTMRAACDTTEPEATPDWLVLAPTIQIAPLDAALIGAEPGLKPDLTALTEEGCGEVGAVRLVESWSRHLLVWINNWQEDGFAPLHDAWRGRSAGIGRRATLDLDGETLEGVYLGLDENGDLLLKTEQETRAAPLIAMLSRPSAWPPVGEPQLRPFGPTPRKEVLLGRMPPAPGSNGETPS